MKTVVTMGTRTRWFGLVVLVLVACGGGASNTGASKANLLLKREPLQSSGASELRRLTDGYAAPEGDHWLSALTTRLRSSNAFAIYDLGEQVPIAGAWLQGDNNDEYVLEISSDKTHFEPLWIAGPAAGSGLRERWTVDLAAHGRYLRLSAKGGDGSFTLSELQVFSTVPTPFPPAVSRKAGFRADVQLRTRIILFGLSMVLFVWLAHRGSRWWWVALLAALPLFSGWEMVSSVVSAMPVEQRGVSLMRGMIGMVAALTIAREAFGPTRFLAHRGAVLANLATCGLLGVLSFYNLGSPQFHDHALNQPTFVHHLDLRQYYATAKYFPELGYREMYAADVAAYLDDNPQLTLDGMANQNMRDLSNHQVSTVGAQRERILAVKQRFSPERWEAYKLDQRYFRQAMSLPRYLEMMNDLGGNATPVWITICYLGFNRIAATDAPFELTALADPLLLLAALLVIGFTFGPRTACVCAVLFGANDLIMYGSNWGGATLRHDWMAYLAFGACALRRERFSLAGVLLAMATLIRAFPALSLLALGIPLFWQVVETIWMQRRLPTRAELLSEQRWLLKVALSAAVTAVVAVGISSAILGWSAWPDWYLKVKQLTSDPHANHISLRSLIAGFEFDQMAVLRPRMPLMIAGCVFYVAAVAIGGRGKRPEQLAMLGMILLPVLFYPANYYIHFVWLLPMIVIERGKEERPLSQVGANTWLCLLLMCAAQYWTTLIPDQSLHFYIGSAVLFAAITTLLLVYMRPNLSPLLEQLTNRPPKAAPLT